MEFEKKERRKFTEIFDCSCFLLKYPGFEPNIWIIIVSMPPIDQIMFIYVLGGVSSFNLFLVNVRKNVRLKAGSHFHRHINSIQIFFFDQNLI